MSITNDGAGIEDEFAKITGAARLVRGDRADAILRDWRVEVKKVSAGVLNQVRPLEYITVAAKDVTTGDWYVLPAERILEVAIAKVRGQHTENALECCTVTLDKFADCRVDAALLADRVESVSRTSHGLTQIRCLAYELLREMREVAADQRERMRQALLPLLPQCSLFDAG